ncbi:MAG: hypothetical protein RL367_204 [Pseudomonadota bacterium]
MATQSNFETETGGASLTIMSSVATIQFNRPAARNAMLYQTWCALPGMIAMAEQDKCVDLIIMRGKGGHFGAGNDISEFGSLRGDAAGALAFGRAMADAMLAVENATKPVIMAIEGCCYGASVALGLAGDLRFAADTARFAITPAKLGALYLQTDLHRLVATIGPGQARKMIYTAQTIDAAEARLIGLVDTVVAHDRFDAELGQLSQTILRGSPFTLKQSKRMLRNAGLGPAQPETEESLRWFVAALQGEDFAEGYDAFMAKRAPQFRQD